jgi:hypothetical protein
MTVVTAVVAERMIEHTLVVVCHNTATNQPGVLTGVPASWYGSVPPGRLAEV